MLTCSRDLDRLIFLIPLVVRIEWCPGEDSNLHASRHTDLNRARLPIPPPGPAAGAAAGRCVECAADVSGAFGQVNADYARISFDATVASELSR